MVAMHRELPCIEMQEVKTRVLPSGGVVRLCWCNRPALKGKNLCYAHQTPDGENHPNYKTGEYTRENLALKALAKNPALQAKYQEHLDEVYQQEERHKESIVTYSLQITHLLETIADLTNTLTDLDEHDTHDLNDKQAETRTAIQTKLSETYAQLGDATKKRAEVESLLQKIRLNNDSTLSAPKAGEFLRALVATRTFIQDNKDAVPEEYYNNLIAVITGAIKEGTKAAKKARIMPS
jgi:hypothetical protein